MAKIKRKKTKVGFMPFNFASTKKGKAKSINLDFSDLTIVLKVIVVVCLLAGIVVGFMFLEKYVNKTIPVYKKTALLELVNPPRWVNEHLKSQIYVAATASGEDLKLDEDAAKSVQKNIETFTGWLDQVKVQTTSETLRIQGRWRKPLALVKSGQQRFFVDSNLVVLDFVPMDGLPIVKVEGISSSFDLPPVGKIWEKDDLAAAVAILVRLNQRDELEGPDSRLLYEIDRIDVSNFDGRKSSRQPHIVFYTVDETKIIWGAELGKWQRYLEATDEQKIASLYSYYKEKGSLCGGVKYIDLCALQKTIPLPIDRY